MGKIFRKIFYFFLRSFIWSFLLSIVAVLLFRFLPVGLTPLMLIRSAEYSYQQKNYPLKHQWVSLEKISPYLQRAVIVAEDFKFKEHNGFDWEAIEKARKWNKTHKRVKGASTISQQTAKNLFLWPSRSWVRKGLEAYFTVLIEFFWPKSRIMEVYLNIIEFGPGVYGAQAAAQKYFKKTAQRLSPAEAALMTAVLPNPRRFKIHAPSSYVYRRQQAIMNRMWVTKSQKIESKLDSEEDSDAEASE